jgi:hypothetical protein
MHLVRTSQEEVVAVQWWYRRGDEVKGPVDAGVIRTLVQEGMLDPSSAVMPEGSSEWATIAQHAPTLGLIRSPEGRYLVGSPSVDASARDFTTAIILSILVGTFGVDRFYLGYTGLGIAKLLTLGACGVWTLVDIILIATNKLPDAEGRPLARR